jgi:hypothetical protein
MSFGTQFVRRYRRLPHGWRAVLPSGLRGWMRERIAPGFDDGRMRSRGAASGLEIRLWSGYSRSALAALAALKADEGDPAGAAEAAWVLARWHAVAGDFAAALAEITAMRRLAPATARLPRQYLLEALFLIRLGRGPEARARLEAGLRRRAPGASARLLLSSACNPAAGGDDAAAALAHLNAVLAVADLAPLAARGPGGRLGFDALEAAGPVREVHDPDAVSVIVPAFDCAGTIGTALAGLAAQSWRNLEILVVDDASRDATADTVMAATARDPRIRLIRMTQNGGSYAARNLGLREARGTFVTVHDADDWSHPEKIARQVADLRARDVAFNLSAWVRTTEDLVFAGPWRPTENLLVRNFSSVLFRRAIVERTGPWDTARVSADREFVNRLQTVFGLKKQKPLLPDAPLAFGRASETSITAAKATHVASQYHGIRRDYHEACDAWHASLDPAAVREWGVPGAPPFCVAPAAVRSARTPEPERDVLLIGDFVFSGGTYQSALNMLRAGLAEGLRCAVMHYRRHDEDLRRPLKPEFRRFAAEHDVRIVAPGEAAATRHVIVTYPPVFEEVVDRFPDIDHAHLTVVVNQMAERDLARTDIAYDPLRVRAHLRELLGGEGTWVPISQRVRSLMAADGRYPAPGPDTWTPLIDTDAWCARTPIWRGGTGRAPVIGRHGRDHRLKWPVDAATLRAAYCADRPAEVRFLGGARHARKILGSWPKNWRADAFGARDVQAFLADLDFFLHYPHPTYIEEFGRAPMEAMAMGMPAILPPEFEETFGAAALYAPPEEVWNLVARLWRDEAAWHERVEAGRAFVESHCSHAAFAARLAQIEAAGRAPGADPAAAPAQAPAPAAPETERPASADALSAAWSA